jgi:uncharacterized protein YndB with AHSA1/START domain
MQKTGQLEIQLIGETEILFTRLFNASAQHVFDAHTKPDLFSRWMLGPPGWTMPVCEIDLRVGGRYRCEWAHPEEGSFEVSGQYLEIDAPARIRHTEVMMGAETINVITFTEQGGRTLMSQKINYANAEARQAAIDTGMAEGMEAGYVNLDGMFAEAK